MKERKSLKSAVTKASIHTAILTGTLVIVGFFIYYSAAKMVARRSVLKEIELAMGHDVEQILPSFLLPEQKDALPEQLERIKNKNNLSRTLIVQSSSDLPDTFKSCTPEQTPHYCLSSDENEVGAVFPIAAGGQVLGYLVEARSVSRSYTFETVAAVAAASAIIIVVFVLILFSLFHKIMGSSVPRDIDRLLQYVQSLLQEKTITKKPDLEFSDFAVLRDGISAIFNNYKRTQNQAIIGHFATGVLHDIKTQLQSIVVASELADESKGDRQKYASRLENLQNVIQKNLPDLQGIIRSTLDANKEISLNPQMTDLETTIKTSIDYAKAQVDFQDFNVEIMGLKEKIILKHDRIQSIRLFFNLIKNAFEAQNKKSHDDKKVLIDVSNTDDKIFIRVEDAGAGIKGNYETIFDPFITTKKHGVGLGLYNVQKIAAAHGWNITAKTSENLGGACFEVTIPKDASL